MYKILLDSSPRVLASHPWFLFEENQTYICCVRLASDFGQKIEFVISRQSRALSTGAR